MNAEQVAMLARAAEILRSLAPAQIGSYTLANEAFDISEKIVKMLEEKGHVK